MESTIEGTVFSSDKNGVIQWKTRLPAPSVAFYNLIFDYNEQFIHMKEIKGAKLRSVYIGEYANQLYVLNKEHLTIPSIQHLPQLTSGAEDNSNAVVNTNDHSTITPSPTPSSHLIGFHNTKTDVIESADKLNISLPFSAKPNITVEVVDKNKSGKNNSAKNNIEKNYNFLVIFLSVLSIALFIALMLSFYSFYKYSRIVNKSTNNNSKNNNKSNKNNKNNNKKKNSSNDTKIENNNKDDSDDNNTHKNKDVRVDNNGLVLSPKRPRGNINQDLIIGKLTVTPQILGKNIFVFFKFFFFN